ncbi:NAD(P)/FAD-dependent oxidoreductase [uncultured Rikenella sp.]|uniref:phytoene desaturase family protein n=1 Tax=uncultured Rikenella sp. TaxID=368003 RepID=UPI00262AEE31|nr:NAD(P)/FAD-dependent oxidoreductase [uncultured Rikenella sp.]
MKPFDVLIIGSGLGGLACGALLSREGMNVCVVEKHARFGGCLQSFRRQGRLLDTGMHYVGSIAPGQILHQYLKYFGILDRLRLSPLDPACYDEIRLDGRQYPFACGYDRFIDRLAEQFPAERADIEAYCRLLHRVGRTISVETLRSGRLSSGGEEYMGISAAEAIAGCTRNPVLRNVLAGSILLHSGDRQQTSLYEHAMIHHSYIESAGRFVGGSQHVADALVETIRRNGGTVRADSEATRLILRDGRIDAVEINRTEQLGARYVISDIHPVPTFALLDGPHAIRPRFLSHLQSLPQSIGFFTTWLLLRPGSYPSLDRNYYLHNRRPDLWSLTGDHLGCRIPVVLVSAQPSDDGRFSDVISLLLPMEAGEWAPWAGTTTGKRGDAYTAWKERYARASIDFVAPHLPGLREAIQSVCTASPLTYRDYTGTPDGSAYGLVKDCRNPLLSRLSPRTKVENLFLTGQNLNVHGFLGVCVSAAATCCALVGETYLTRKIGYE